jgi:hypothetical protein
VPRVSAIYGIVITMYINEGVHPGRSHFHARYAGAGGQFRLETLEPIVGKLPSRANKLVLKWAHLHQIELRRNWDQLRCGGQTTPIAPLEVKPT